MARHIPGLETELRRARSKERPESQGGREKAQFYGDQAWSSPAGGETFTGGHREFDAYARIGGNMAGTKRHVQDFPEEYKPNDQSDTGRSSVNTGGLPTGGGREHTGSGEAGSKTGGLRGQASVHGGGPPWETTTIEGRTRIEAERCGSTGREGKVEQVKCSRGLVFPGEVMIPVERGGKEGNITSGRRWRRPIE